MSENGSHAGDAPRASGDAAPPSLRRRAPWPLMVVAALFIVVPFLAWYGTWFGRTLGDEEIEKYLSEGKPRQAQHALSQVAERIIKGDASAARFFPQVLKMAESPVADLRMTAAWVMGLEHKSEEFRAALHRLMEDPEPIVRRNAALALVRYGDAAARPELLAMLRPFEVKARTEGSAETALSVGTPVKRESLLVRYKVKPNLSDEARSPLPGRVEQVFVKEGDQFHAGDRLFVISPDAEQVRDALIGLSYLGEESDAPEVERYARGVEGMPEEVKAQAARTLGSIKSRAARR
ncbi:MAG TPA: HEAT repeat domain-containing protein [Pyrinomonadaceae bacterium]|nr:HEAT repeat domain-containing protein [Pyrinomonadaceae bacterium]